MSGTCLRESLSENILQSIEFPGPCLHGRFTQLMMSLMPLADFIVPLNISLV